MKFKEYVEKYKIPYRRFAVYIGVNQSFICHVLSGKRKFSDLDALKVKAFSRGEITEYDDRIYVFLAEIAELKKKI